MLGNPQTNPNEQIYGQMAHFAGSSLIPPSLFQKFESSCMDVDSQNDDSCDQVVDHIMELTKNI